MLNFPRSPTPRYCPSPKSGRSAASSAPTVQRILCNFTWCRWRVAFDDFRASQHCKANNRRTAETTTRLPVPHLRQKVLVIGEVLEFLPSSSYGICLRTLGKGL